MWGRMLRDLETAKTLLRSAAGDAGELLSPEAALLVKELYETTAAASQAGWEQYHEAHRQLLLKRKKR